jgi:hypothetical protein
MDALQVDATGIGSRRRTRRRGHRRHRVVRQARSLRSTTIIAVGFVAAAAVLAYCLFVCFRLVSSSFLPPLLLASSALAVGTL